MLLDYKSKRGSHADLGNREEYKDGNKSLVGICQSVNMTIN